MATYKVSGLTIKRDGNSYTASWKLDTDVKKKFKSLLVNYFYVYRASDGTVKTKEYSKSLATSKKSLKLTFDRDYWYPVASHSKKGRQIKKIIVEVRGVGSKKTYDPAEATYAFAAPPKPTVSLDTTDNVGELSAALSTSASDTSTKERYQTHYRWQYQQKGSSLKVVSNNDTKSAKTTVKYTYPYASGVKSGSWAKVSILAWNEGVYGDSDTVEKSYTFSQPSSAEITQVRKSGQQVQVWFNIVGEYTSSTKRADGVQLMRYTGPSILADRDGWTAVDGAEGNYKARVFNDNVSDATPPQGQHTWYCIRVTYGTLIVYSDPVEAGFLYTPPASTTQGTTKLLSVDSNGDGESVTAVVAWLPSTDYDSVCISWSDDANGWRSTEDPETFSFSMAEWADGSYEDGGKTYRTASVKIAKLDDGTTYWFKACRQSDPNDWSDGWSNVLSCTCSSVPATPILTAPDVVERGKDVAFTWSGGTQTAYVLEAYEKGSYQVALTSGEGSQTSAVIPYADIAGQNGIPSVPDSVSFRVGISKGGDYTYSEPVAVTFATRPTATLSFDSATIGSRDWEFTVNCDQDGATATVELVSQGITVRKPDSDSVQASGEVVWSGSYVCGAAIDIPDSAELIDGGDYVLRATPYASGLAGDPVEALLTVTWAHQAVATASCPVTVSGKTATLTPAAPEGAMATDVCDVYRMTPDGAYLVAQGLAFGTAVTDPWAPFSDEVELAYRVVTRTADGDLDWDDFEYSMPGDCVRIDWDGDSLELPHSVSVSDSWEKDFETRTYLDGTEVGGYWNPASVRTATITATAIRSMEAEALVSLRNLARHTGSVFVRTPDGCAYEADVQVSLDAQHSSMLASVSLAVTEVALQSYLAQVGEVAEEA